MPSFANDPGGPQFRAPGFLQPKTFEAIDRIPQSFDEMFDRVAKAKALEDQKKTQKKNKENAMNMFMLKNPDIPPELLQASQEPGFAQTMQTGRDRSDFLQDPMTGGTVPPQMSDVENQATDFFQQRREQQNFEKRKQEASLQPADPSTIESVIARKLANKEITLEDAISQLGEVKKSKRAPKSTFDLGPSEMFVHGKSPADVPMDQVQVQPIPGSKLDREFKKQDRDARKAKSATKRKQIKLRDETKVTIGQIDKVMSQANKFTTGIIAAKLSEVNQGALDLKKNLDTLFAKAAFDRLQKMRDESLTGGALGQVSERELKLLGSAVTSMDQAQSPEQFIENMNIAKTHYTKFLTSITQADSYEEKYIMLRKGGWGKEEAESLTMLDVEEGFFEKGKSFIKVPPENR